MTDCDKMMKTVIVSVNKMRKLMLILLSAQFKKLMLTLLSAHCSGRGAGEVKAGGKVAGLPLERHTLQVNFSPGKEIWISLYI